MLLKVNLQIPNKLLLNISATDLDVVFIYELPAKHVVVVVLLFF